MANIVIRVTDGGKLRARIKEPKRKPYEVTIGGIQWKHGLGREYEGVIKNKCRDLLHNVRDQIKKELQHLE